MKKEAYEIAEIDVCLFNSEDVITTSGIYDDFNPDKNEGSPVGG